MDWAEAVRIVHARTGNERLRWLCSDDNPDPESRESHRRLALRLALTPFPSPPDPIPTSDQTAPSEPLANVPLAGDLVAIMTEKVGAARLAHWAAEKFGVDCGCSVRQELLNRWDAKLRRRLGLPLPQGPPELESGP